MQTVRVTIDDLRRLRGPFLPMIDRLPIAITAAGCLEILQRRMLGLFCSVQCPDSIAAMTLEVVQKIAAAGNIITGGFHAPVERACFEQLLEAPHPVVLCPARSLDEMRVPPELAGPLNERRLLLLSSFPAGAIRVDGAASARRNRFVAALADQLFVAYAAPGGKTEQLCRDAMTWGKVIFTPDVPENASLIAFGVRRVTPRNVLDEMARARLSRPASIPAQL